MVENLRQNIIKIAETTFVKYGIRSVSIDDLCNELHISKKTFYSEFRQKDELVAIVLESISERNKKEDKEYTSLLNTGNAIDFALLFRRPALKERKKKYEKFMRDVVKYYPEVHKNFLDSRRDDIRAFILSNIQRGVSESLYRKELELLAVDSFIVSIILNMFVSMVTNSIDEETTRKDEIFDMKIDCYLRMICNADGIKYYEQKNI